MALSAFNLASRVQRSKPGEYRVVDAGDLKAAPLKYIGKPIEVRGVYVFHANEGEYRFGTTELATIFAEAVEPPNARQAIEANCGEIKKTQLPQCKKTIRFTPERHQSDILSGYRKREVFFATTVEIVPAAPAATKGKGKRR